MVTSLYGVHPTQQQLLSLALIASKHLGISLDREASRRKIVLLKWFDENIDVIEPFLKNNVVILNDKGNKVGSYSSPLIEKYVSIEKLNNDAHNKINDEQMNYTQNIAQLITQNNKEFNNNGMNPNQIKIEEIPDSNFIDENHEIIKNESIKNNSQETNNNSNNNDDNNKVITEYHNSEFGYGNENIRKKGYLFNNASDFPERQETGVFDNYIDNSDDKVSFIDYEVSDGK
ncbi:hypothetical protein TRFO_06457 [Tritrichomonas foetus]|uniref:Uncharacterized protein n=1 Tax=Tritrichomonas foetus TaxID=1144522 RepID=A0A1J4JYT9_9EUKA|nr:hypothetical protein TRFO_06457 [Tritrichomonas foetus]|eukprot:OHT04139.1 hypothetical protein TRFO_06457 [Tritrichomonas foetus]